MFEWNVTHQAPTNTDGWQLQAGSPKKQVNKTNQESRLSCRNNLGGDRLPVNCEAGPGEESYIKFCGQKSDRSQDLICYGVVWYSFFEIPQKGQCRNAILSTFNTLYTFSWLLHSLFQPRLATSHFVGQEADFHIGTLVEKWEHHKVDCSDLFSRYLLYVWSLELCVSYIHSIHITNNRNFTCCWWTKFCTRWDIWNP